MHANSDFPPTIRFTQCLRSLFQGSPRMRLYSLLLPQGFSLLSGSVRLVLPPSVNAHWQAKARDELVINSTSRSCNESNVNEPGNCFADV